MLDLYAGSGALGCEAASRGAAHVTLVEKARRAAEVCRANAAALNAVLGAPVVQVAASSVEQALALPGDSADLILADPPYPESGPAFHAVLAAAAAHVPEDWSTPRPARVPDARTLLIVAHGAVIRAAAGLALALEGADFAHLARVSNARAVILDGTFAGEGPGAWSLLGYDV